jgi:hypothetical protein
MSLQNAVETPEGEYINEPITATVTWPKTQPSPRGGVFYKATLTDGQFQASVACNADLFSAHNNKRMTFSVEGKGKGFSIKRKGDYNGKAQLTFGDNVSASPAGQATPGQQAATEHSQQTQAFPVNTGNTPAPQRQQQRQGVEGVTAGMACHCASRIHSAQILAGVKVTPFSELLNMVVREVRSLEVNGIQEQQVPPNDESRAGDWDDGQGKSPPF